MTLRFLKDMLSLDCVCGSCDCEEWSGVYSGDVLSRAMTRIKPGNVWITVVSNINTVAVANLTKAACVILAEGAVLPKEAVAVAEENRVTVFSSPLTVYELCAKIAGAVAGAADPDC